MMCLLDGWVVLGHRCRSKSLGYSRCQCLWRIITSMMHGHITDVGRMGPTLQSLSEHQNMSHASGFIIAASLGSLNGCLIWGSLFNWPRVRVEGQGRSRSWQHHFVEIRWIRGCASKVGSRRDKTLLIGPSGPCAADPGRNRAKSTAKFNFSGYVYVFCPFWPVFGVLEAGDLFKKASWRRYALIPPCMSPWRLLKHEIV